MYDPLVGHKYAAICSIIINIPFVIGELILVAIAYFFRDFRTLLRVAFLPPLAAIILWFFIPESPRWLISRKRLDEAKNILIQGISSQTVASNLALREGRTGISDILSLRHLCSGKLKGHFDI